MKAAVCQSCQSPLPRPGDLPLAYAVAVAERVLKTRQVGPALLAKARKGRKG